jgi:hypothetical protein
MVTVLGLMNVVPENFGPIIAGHLVDAIERESRYLATGLARERTAPLSSNSPVTRRANLLRT